MQNKLDSGDSSLGSLWVRAGRINVKVDWSCVALGTLTQSVTVFSYLHNLYALSVGYH